MKLLLHTHELNVAKEQINDYWKETRKNNSYRRKLQRKYRVLQKAMQKLCIEFQGWMNPT